MSAKPIFIFYRTGEVIKSGNEVIGNLGILSVSGTQYFTVERKIPEYVHIPLGLYTLKMEYSANYQVNGEPRKQFRIMGHNVVREAGGLANLLIHQGSSPSGLTGCIGPGKSKTTTGISQSGEAIEELIAACGGFQIQETAASLSVVSGPQTNVISDLYKFGGIFSSESNSKSESAPSHMSELNELLNH